MVAGFIPAAILSPLFYFNPVVKWLWQDPDMKTDDVIRLIWPSAQLNVYEIGNLKIAIITGVVENPPQPVVGPLKVTAEVIPVNGAVSSLGFNLIGDDTNSTGFGAQDLLGTVGAPLDPLLGPLADNGGPTEIA